MLSHPNCIKAQGSCVLATCTNCIASSLPYPKYKKCICAFRTCSLAYGLGSLSARRPGRKYISPSSLGPSSTCNPHRSNQVRHLRLRGSCCSRPHASWEVSQACPQSTTSAAPFLKLAKTCSLSTAAPPPPAPTSTSAANALTSSSV